MDPARAVPPHIITSEIRNSYSRTMSGGEHTILVLHHSAYGDCLATQLTIPNTAKVSTILQAVWQHWSGPSEDQLPLPSCLTLFAFRDRSALGWPLPLTVQRLTRSQRLCDIDHCGVFLLIVRRSHSMAEVEASCLFRDQAMKGLIMSWWSKPNLLECIR
jgi:hypothetical protein